MKTSIFSIISIAALPFVLFSCNKVADSSNGLPAPEISIQASIPTDATKVVPVVPESGKGLDWNWSAGDQLAVTSGDLVSVFSIRPGFEPKKASFIGKQVSGSKFSIIYPGSCTSEAALEELSFADQNQAGNDVKDQLSYFALLKDVDAYASFEFGDSWAVSHGGSFKQGGVLRFCLTLPEETTVVNRITLKAGAPVFHKGNAADALSNELSIGLSEVTLGSDHTVTAWMNTSWFDDVIPAGTSLAVNVAAGDFNWTADITPEVDKTIKAGFVNKITLPAEAWVTAGRYADGDGTLENPWQIKTPTQLTYVRDDMVSKEMRYFKLIADIDMAGIEWMPLNNVANAEDETKAYDKFVYFDGDGHTISNLTVGEDVAYPSFAGVLYGTIKDVTFTNAVINGGENKSGVVAGYMGTSQNFTANEISNVVVKNATVAASRHVGALVGQVATGENTITDCHVLGGVVNGAEYAGGFCGYIQQAAVTACSSSAEVSGTKHVGGFVGKTETPVFNQCWYDGPKVTATDNTKNAQSAGFVGYAAKANGLGGEFTDCYVKGTVIDASAGQRIGGFVGQADLGNTFTKCSVQNVEVNAGQNSAGFVGVDYATTSELVPGGGIYRCAVEGGTINVSGNNCGGFVGYPEGATIHNSYTTMDVEGGEKSAIGGFTGVCKTNVSIQWCYASGVITAAGTPVGAFTGEAAGDATTHIKSCIAWNAALPFVGKSTGTEDIADNYVGTEGTLAAKAAELGWDPAVWDFAAKLK